VWCGVIGVVWCGVVWCGVGVVGEKGGRGGQFNITFIV